MSDLTALPDRERIVAAAARSFLAVLPPELAETVRAAAIPHWFDAPLLAALLALPAEEAGRRHTALQEMPFVQAVGDRGHALHELTRRLLLDELWTERPADFRTWGRRAAEAFDGQAGDAARIEAIYHWLAADPDRGADLVWEWGAEWNNTFRFNLVYALVQAGLEHDAGARLAGRARGWVYFWKGLLHSLYSENQEALESLRIATEAAGDDRQLEANCIRCLGDVHVRLAEYPQARQRYEAALPISQAIGDRLGEANCIKSLGNVHVRLAEYPQARQRYEAAWPIYQAIGDRLGEANCIRALGDVHVSLAEYPQARQRYEAALPICQAIGDRSGAANCISRLGDVHVCLAEYPQARQRYEAALPIFQAIGDRLGEANCISSLGDVHVGLEEYTSAYTAYEDAAARYRELGLPSEEASALNSLANAYLAQDLNAQAAETYGRAIALFPDQAMWYRNRASTYIEMKDLANANADLARAAELQPDHPYLPLRRGDLAFKQGQYDEAAGHYRQALAALPNLNGAHFGLGLALICLGQKAKGLAEVRGALELTYAPQEIREFTEELEELVAASGSVGDRPQQGLEEALALVRSRRAAQPNTGRANGGAK